MPAELSQLNVQPHTHGASVCVQGISFTHDAEWRVWLNGQQIGPNEAAKFNINQVTATHICVKNKCYKVGECYIPPA